MAQQVSVSIGSGSVAPGASISVPLTLTNNGGAQPSGVQWTLGYPASDISNVNVVAGPGATNANKSVNCSAKGASTVCVAYGMNTSAIGAGTLATVTFTVAPAALDSAAPVLVSGVMATDGMGAPIAGTGTAGNVGILQPPPPTLIGLTCTPSTLSPAGVAACQASLSGAAPAAGFPIVLSANNSNITLPSTIGVSAGAMSASFAATAAPTVLTAQTAVLTAKAAGISAAFSLNLTASTWSISGSVGVAGSGSTIAMSGASTATTIADVSGNYMFTSLANGSYTLTPSKSGYAFTPASASITVNGANAIAPSFQAQQTALSGKAFITGVVTAGRAVRNNFSGWVGTQLTVGSNALSVSAVGRLCIAGNFGAHTVKFVNAATGQDLAGGSATVNMAGCTAGQFVYTALPAAITLQAANSYNVASLEAAGGDSWYDYGTVTTTPDAKVANSVYSLGSWIAIGGANTSYVPVNFDYSVVSAPGYITGYDPTGRAVRNDFGGWVGTEFTVGTAALSVSSMGRLCLAGNASTHEVKFVVASSGQDLAGGSAVVNMAGCTPGQFVYAALPAPVSLQPSVSYELASMEAAGGDTWYDYGPITTTLDATVTNSVYYLGGWSKIGSASSSYGLSNFQYTVSAGAPYITSYTSAGRSLRNDFGGWVGAQMTIGSASMSVVSVGRLCVAGNSGSHTVKFVNAANGQDVAGGSAVVNMAGCTAGQFVYAKLPAAIALQAGLSYNLASLEAAAGDTWYDFGAVVTTTDARVTNSVYSNGNWIGIGSTNTSYVPPNFQYHF